ncbi:hypothetical protein FSARC_11146 [Fusarium sarcochroum]|uniref:Uncharacterized protein n=1 Tax=Fusarium sarcochroum TaxID=1208366 RepID=A0A8H4THR3_9HYPO|nr:hypothetical protein FSARC_11146 [Fusarium sarcochroum]
MKAPVGSDAYRNTMQYGYSWYGDNQTCEAQEPWKQSLFETLNAIQPAGRIASNSYQLFINPGLRIEGHPIVPLPLTEYYAQAIKQLCNIRIGQPGVAVIHFDARIAGLRPQKLTLYGPGSSIQQDKTPQKAKDACGTLVVCLPSGHQGADVQLSVDDETFSFSTATSSALDLSAVSWTSGVDHQFTELLSGYRLTISYEIHSATSGKVSSGGAGQWTARVAELLQAWPRNDHMFDKFLYKLDDKNQEGPASFQELKGRDRAVCQVLDNVCAESKLYMLLAEITHEVEDDLADKKVSSWIEGVYTIDGVALTAYKDLNAKKELLGFDLDKLEEREPDSDEDEDLHPMDAMEERETTQRYHDTAVILVHKEHLLRLIAWETAPTCTASVVGAYLAKNFDGKEDTIDWGKWLGPIPKSETIQEFRASCSKITDTIESFGKPLSTSFHVWVEDTIDLKMESQQSWVMKDFDLILERLRERSHKQDWIINTRRHELAFTNAKEMFQSIIKYSDAKLRLSPHDLEPRGCALQWSHKLPAHQSNCKPFLDFVEQSYDIGASKEAAKVIEETFTGLLESKSTWILVQNQPGLIAHVLTPIIRMFQDGRTEPVPALGDVLELLIRIVIKYDLPRLPNTRGGLAFEARGCGYCADCVEVNQFLASPDQLVWKFTAPTDRRTHVEHALRLDESIHTASSRDPMRGRCNTLTVTKKAAERSIGLEQWQRTLGKLKEAMQPLESGFMREFLGEQRYRELILLEGLTPFPQTSSAAGVRRPAPEYELEHNKRPRTFAQTPEVKVEPLIKQEVIVIDD